RSAGKRVLRTIHRVANTHRCDPSICVTHILWRNLVADPLSAQFLCYDQGAAGAGEGIEHHVARIRTATYDSLQQTLRHLAAVETGTLLKRPGDTRKVPRVVVRTERRRCVLGTEYPSIIWYTTARVRPTIVIDKLPRGANPNFRIVKGEVLRVLNEIQQMGVRAAKFFRAVNAECVVPNDPISKVKAKLLGKTLDPRDVLIPD